MKTRDRIGSAPDEYSDTERSSFHPVADAKHRVVTDDYSLRWTVGPLLDGCLRPLTVVVGVGGRRAASPVRDGGTRPRSGGRRPSWMGPAWCASLGCR